MKQTLKFVTGIAVIAGVGYLLIRRANHRRELANVSDNGYETAHDVLYPHKKAKHKKVHFGPVIPRPED